MRIQIQHYTHRFYSSTSSLQAELRCKGDDGELIILRFHDNNSVLPEATSPMANNYILHFRYAEFFNIVDMLRNEGPVLLNFSPAEPSANYLFTFSENVGEGE